MYDGVFAAHLAGVEDIMPETDMILPYDAHAMRHCTGIRRAYYVE